MLYLLALSHYLTTHIPVLDRLYPKYEIFREQQITDIFSPEQLQNAVQLNAFKLETTLCMNDGSGNFTVSPIPVEAQFSPVYAAETGDFNGDDNPDILLGGNLHNVKPEVGRYDASYGTFLAGDGKGGFSSVPVRVSGLHFNGEIRDIMEIVMPTGKVIVASQSNGPVQVFKAIAQ